MIRRVLTAAALCLSALALAGAPAFAQADFSGTWAARYQEDFPERIPGPDLGDYLGLPINAVGAAVRRQLGSRRASRCQRNSAACTCLPTSIAARSTSASGRSGTPRRRSSSPSSTTSAPTTRRGRSTWTAGRIRRTIAAHTWKGFSTGRWQGDMLVVETTHIKHGWHPPQRPADERPGDADRVLRPERRRPDAHQRHRAIRCT